MSIYLALDKTTGDLIKPVGGGVSRVDKGRFIVQQVQSKLRTILSEWVLNPTIGWVNLQDFERNFDAFSIETRARTIILGTEGVLSIDSLSSSYSKRILTLQFTARTIYGNIDLTIPWGASAWLD